MYRNVNYNQCKMIFRRLLFGYFLMILMLMVWVMVNFGRWCPPNQPDHKPDTIFPHAGSNVDHDFRMRDKELRERADRIQESELHLRQLESKLILQYPLEAQSIFGEDLAKLPWIYAITPTYARPVQKAELTRLSQTFLHVRNFHWIIVEDSDNKTALVTRFLKRTGMKYTHLNIGTPPSYKMDDEDPNWLKPRGVLQRNVALDWIRDSVDPDKKGVVYFADDDNTYDLQVFDEMRSTHTVTVWPVGLVGKLMYERPICKDNIVTGFYTYWKPDRPFPMDMAGFAINVRLFFEHPDAKFKLRVKRGYQESELLSKLVTIDQLEPRAEMCQKVLVWHTRTEKAILKNEDKLKAQGRPGSDPRIEV